MSETVVAKASPTLATSAPAREPPAPRSLPARSPGSSPVATNPTGTITFKVFGPQASAPTTCTCGGTTVGTASVSGNGTYNPSGGLSNPSAGNYWWYASYAGDGNNNTAVSTCGSGMSETIVAKASPTLTATGPRMGRPEQRSQPVRFRRRWPQAQAQPAPSPSRYSARRRALPQPALPVARPSARQALAGTAPTTRAPASPPRALAITGGTRATQATETTTPPRAPAALACPRPSLPRRRRRSRRAPRAPGLPARPSPPASISGILAGGENPTGNHDLHSFRPAGDRPHQLYLWWNDRRHSGHRFWEHHVSPQCWSLKSFGR